MLTKSLHTVTAALNVARELVLVSQDAKRHFVDAAGLASATLEVLGYPDVVTFAALDSDPTVAKIVAGCAKLLGSK
jgi:hypothetical protein